MVQLHVVHVRFLWLHALAFPIHIAPCSHDVVALESLMSLWALGRLLRLVTLGGVGQQWLVLSHAVAHLELSCTSSHVIRSLACHVFILSPGWFPIFLGSLCPWRCRAVWPPTPMNSLGSSIQSHFLGTLPLEWSSPASYKKEVATRGVNSTASSTFPSGLLMKLRMNKFGKAARRLQ